MTIYFNYCSPNSRNCDHNHYEKCEEIHGKNEAYKKKENRLKYGEKGYTNDLVCAYLYYI